MPTEDMKMPDGYMEMPKDYMKDTHDINKEAMKPVRKTEAGKYNGVDTTNLPAAGNDVDAAPASNAAPEKKKEMKKMMKKGMKD